VREREKERERGGKGGAQSGRRFAALSERLQLAVLFYDFFKLLFPFLLYLRERERDASRGTRRIRLLRPFRPCDRPWTSFSQARFSFAGSNFRLIDDVGNSHRDERRCPRVFPVDSPLPSGLADERGLERWMHAVCIM